MSLTIAERVASYRQRYPRLTASWPWLGEEGGKPTFYGVWVIGAVYGNQTKFYGAFPRGYLNRVMALFPDVEPSDVLHAFSGSLPEGPYTRLDLVQPAELSGSVVDVRRLVDAKTPGRLFPLVTADPPYTSDDAAHYKTPMVNRSAVMRALAEVTAPGGFLVWLDTQWPMYNKETWRTAGRVMLIRSTNHRVRAVHFFQRVGGQHE